MLNFRVPLISKFGAMTTILFILFSSFGRFLFPFGDEPDFGYRAARLIEVDHVWWSPYSIFQNMLQGNLEIISNCKINASPFSIWAQIDSATCTESLEQIIMRLLLTIFIASPILLVIIFRRFFTNTISILGIKSKNQYWNQRLNAVGISLLFPSMVYYLGVLAEEQLSLVVSLSIFIFWESWIVLALLSALLIYIDFGNSIVMLYFIVLAKTSICLYKHLGLKVISFILFSITAFLFSVGVVFLDSINRLFLYSDKADAIYTSLSNSVLIDKYPVILRPVITYMNFIFSTPISIKVVPAYLLSFLLIYIMLLKIRKTYIIIPEHRSKKILTDLNIDIILSLVGVCTILSLVFLLPTYANAKYYIFILPFFISLALRVHTKVNVAFYSSLLSIITYFSLTIYRL